MTPTHQPHARSKGALDSSRGLRSSAPAFATIRVVSSLLVLCALGIALLCGCHDGDPVSVDDDDLIGPNPFDRTPPSKVSDLAIAATSTRSITLRWTAVGDEFTI